MLSRRMDARSPGQVEVSLAVSRHCPVNKVSKKGEAKMRMSR